VELVAVADPLERARGPFQETFGVRNGYAEAEAMLRAESLDLVSICLWHPLHAPMTALAARYRPKAILCEKPMATCLGEADAMLAACAEAGVKLAVGHQRRFNPSWTRARELIAAGAIGAPHLVAVQTGEGLLNCGTHVVDAIRYLLGDPETEWVMGAVERGTDRWERDTAIEDCCMGLIQFRGGAQALVECDLTGTSNVENYTVRGSDGLLEVKQREVRLLRGSFTNDAEAATSRAVDPAPSRAASDDIRKDGWEVIDTGYENPWIAQARSLVAWVEGAPSHRGDGRQARATLAILMAIYQSAREHAVVRMPLDEAESPLARMIAEGKLPVRQPGRYDIRAFLAMEPADRERYAAMLREGKHPREILQSMGKSQ
jgi:predicted dehydrogenase